MDIRQGMWFKGPVGMKVYKADRPRGGVLRSLFWILAVLVLLIVAYLILPFGVQRAVLLGSDARADEASRSDTILITAVGTGRGAAMLSIPRDTLLQIPSHGQDKVNAAFAFGGPDLTVRTLEDFTGLPINNYVVIHFEGVEDIVNAMGGITINVKEPIQFGSDGQSYSLQAGRQTMDGKEALGYVRYRGGPRADIGRIERQQQFVEALGAEATSAAKLSRLPQTSMAIWRNIDTNMNPLQAARFAIRLRLTGGSGPVETYPGRPQYIGGVSYWIPDTATGQQVVDSTIK